MEVSPQQTGVQKVSFTFPTADTDLTETARLLETFSQQPPTTTLPGPSTAVRLVAPPPQVATAAPPKPENMSTAPASVDEWPMASLRLACTHCGHYIETMPQEETGGVHHWALMPPSYPDGAPHACHVHACGSALQHASYCSSRYAHDACCTKTFCTSRPLIRVHGMQAVLHWTTRVPTVLRPLVSRRRQVQVFQWVWHLLAPVRGCMRLACARSPLMLAM